MNIKPESGGGEGKVVQLAGNTELPSTDMPSTDSYEVQVTELTHKKMRALLRSNELLGIELSEATQDLALTQEALRQAQPYIGFETKFAIMCVQLLPGFLRRWLRRAVAFVYAVKDG